LFHPSVGRYIGALLLIKIPPSFVKIYQWFTKKNWWSMRIIFIPWKRQQICLSQTSQASQVDDHATATDRPLGSPRGQDSRTPYSADK
jgi:hypothetical protein